MMDSDIKEGFIQRNQAQEITLNSDVALIDPLMEPSVSTA